jgi:hypothetical protein
VIEEVCALVPLHPGGRDAAGVDPVACAASAGASERVAMAARRVETEGERRMRLIGVREWRRRRSLERDADGRIRADVC